MPFCEHISHERLLELLDYNEATGDFRWRKDKTGGVKAGDIAGTILTPKGRNTSYRTVSLDNRMYRAHRLAWFYVHKEWPKQQIDHIDGNGLNNALANLRDVSQLGNQRNRKLQKNNTSGVSGVSWVNEESKWKAVIKVEGETKYLGLFVEFEDAVKARAEAEKKYGFHKNHGRKQ